ncbi:toll/interleukin-1 receptor domain-containing protein [Bhargavaea beijingensis]|uniref:toll/interleukin-1 receptor domain-containing protein n=1 Tax=Bhargavaea beijingensis TaxID=426756 RepID=UPI0022249106|nr:toll/interleukin-1 receptor domain-containing protein [Bhargavaea beijingensis]MCW1928677.1 TIR domain-containing protein [Bhargavaea beijingensis]
MDKLSIQTLMTQIKRLEREISIIDKKIAAEKVKESKALDKISKSQKRIESTKSTASLKSAIREYESASKDLAKAKDGQAKLSKQLSDKSDTLVSKKNNLVKAQAKDREKHQKEIEKLQKEALDAQQIKVQQLIRNSTSFSEKEYDVFISHASEDKKSFVEPLARALQEGGITTWYDTDQIGWGQSIRSSIDAGLIKSRFCIVVLSQHFLDKYWTNYELNGIFQKDANTQESVILPIWHNVTKDEIQKRNLSITDTLAMNTALTTIDEIVSALQKLLEPNEER